MLKHLRIQGIQVILILEILEALEILEVLEFLLRIPQRRPSSSQISANVAPGLAQIWPDFDPIRPKLGRSR